MKILALSEGAFTIDKTKKFVPFNIDKDQLNDRPIGSLLVEIQPFVVITKKDIILLDTGLGYVDNTGQPQIHNNLQDLGVDPDSVTKVIMSHLHKDHAGGIGLQNNGEIKKELSFKNATYYISAQELSFALESTTSSYVSEDLNLLRNNPQVILLPTKGVIDNYINYEETGGHSIHHMAIWIKEDDEIVFFGGDVAPQLQQMKSRFVAKYDYDGKKSMEFRRGWLDKGTIEKWTFLFYHDIKNPVYQF